MPLTDQGYQITLVDQYVALLNQAILTYIDPALDLQPEGALGQLIGIFAGALAEGDANALAVWRSAFIESATGESLDALVALSGVYRLPAAGSTVSLTLAGVNGTVIAAAQRVSSPSTGVVFVTTSGGTITGGNLTVTATSQNTGPVSANAGTLTRIDTPLVGWSTVTNPLDATLGRDEELDADLRARYTSLLFAAGASTVDSIRDAVLRVPGVTSVSVYENDGSDPGSAAALAGVPLHAFETVVINGDNTAIRTAIFLNKAAGIQAYGTSAANIVDSQGITHLIGLTRPSVTTVYTATTLVKNSDYPIDGNAQVSAAIAAYINALSPGESVIRSKLIAVVADMPGVVDVTALTLGTSPTPVGTANLVPASYRVQYQANVGNQGVTAS